MIKVEHLSYSYGSRRALSDISFEFGGGRLAILGANGAGKSTLLKILATSLAPSSGEYQFCGVSTLTEKGRTELRRNLGWLPQAFGYEPSARVSTYLCYLAWLKGVAPDAVRQVAATALDAVNLQDRATDRIRGLSGGMLRRLGIAQALLGDPELLLLDEPTAGLDPAQRHELYELLRSLPAARCTVLSTHSIEDVEALAQSVMIIGSGQINWRGSLGSLQDEAAGMPLREFVPALMADGAKSAT